MDPNTAQGGAGYCLGTLTGLLEWISNMDPLRDLQGTVPLEVLELPTLRRRLSLTHARTRSNAVSQSISPSSPSSVTPSSIPDTPSLPRRFLSESSLALSSESELDKDLDLHNRALSQSRERHRERERDRERSSFSRSSWRSRSVHKLMASLIKEREHRIDEAHRNAILRVSRKKVSPKQSQQPETALIVNNQLPSVSPVAASDTNQGSRGLVCSWLRDTEAQQSHRKSQESGGQDEAVRRGTHHLVGDLMLSCLEFG